MTVTLLMPCLDEAQGLAQVLRRVPPWVDEVLVVDNGSTDGSADVARRLGARVIQEARRGYGQALLTGLAAASGDLVAAMDSDGSYPPESLEPLVEHLVARNLAFVAGSRFPLTAAGAMSRVRRAGNRLLTAAANLLFGAGLSDSQSGMWVIRRSVLPRLHLTQAAYAFSEEFKLEALRHLGDLAQEQRIAYAERAGRSKLHPRTGGWDCLWFLVRKRLGLIRACPRATWREVLERVPSWAVAWLAFSLPVSLGLSEAVLVVGVAAWACSRVLQRRWRTGSPGVAGLFLLFLGAAVLSMVNSVSVPASVRGLTKVLKAFAVFLLASEEIRTPAQLRRVVTALLAGTAIAAADGLWQRLAGTDPLYHQPLGETLKGLRRICGTYHHADDLGLFLSVALPVALAALRAGPAWRLRWWPRLAVVLSVPALFLTFCRGGLIAFGVAVVGLLVMWRAWRWLAGVVLAGLIMVAMLPAPIKTWVREQPSVWAILFESNEPGMSRPQIWRAAGNMFRAHPWIGVGVNTFVKTYDRYRAPGDTNATAPYAHNHYLHMLAEVGIVGFVAFLLLLGAGARRVARLLTGLTEPLRTLLLGLAFALVAFLLNGAVESALYYPRQAPLFWLGFGLLFAPLWSEGATAPSAAAPHARVRRPAASAAA